jgi:phosphoglycolate phosphatase
MATRAVILDLDGTLLDTLEDITDSVNHALTRFGCPPRTLSEIRRFVGNGAVKLLERALPCTLEPSAFEAFYHCYDAYYTAHGQVKTKPYDGASALLQKLRARGLFTAVLSNKQDKAVRILCAHYFPDLLDMATGPTADRRTKPAPDGVLYIAETLGVRTDEILYVGDSEADVQTGRNAGVKTVAALWGFRDRETLEAAGASLFAKKPEDILDFIDISEKS